MSVKKERMNIRNEEWDWGEKAAEDFSHHYIRCHAVAALSTIIHSFAHHVHLLCHLSSA